MLDAKTNYNLSGQRRFSRKDGAYKVISFSHGVFINNHTTWLVEYEETGKRFYKAEIVILKDKEIKSK